MQGPEEDEVWGAVNRLMALTHSEDDRGLVLSMNAFVEDCLGRLLRSYLRDCKASEELLGGFNAPLGTLSARIKACCAVGLLSGSQYVDLEVSRKIRNEFAHNWEGCSFQSEKIAALMEKMGESRMAPTKPNSPRLKYHQTISCTLTELEFLRSQFEKNQQRAPFHALHLALGAQVFP